MLKLSTSPAANPWESWSTKRGLLGDVISSSMLHTPALRSSTDCREASENIPCARQNPHRTVDIEHGVDQRRFPNPRLIIFSTCKQEEVEHEPCPRPRYENYRIAMQSVAQGGNRRYVHRTQIEDLVCSRLQLTIDGIVMVLIRGPV